MNDHMILLVGKSTTGKSTALRGLKNPEGVMYLNAENGKRLPYKSGFKEYTITEPDQVLEAFDVAEQMPDIHTIVIDSVTYLMDMVETQKVITAVNTQKAWGDFQQFFKKVMLKVGTSTKKIIFTGHTVERYDAKEMAIETYVPIKGALKNQGLESYFTVVIATKKVKIADLEKYPNALLNITDRERALGYKHVIQTVLTPETVGERLRAPIDLFADDEVYIDGNIQLVLDRLDTYYA